MVQDITNQIEKCHGEGGLIIDYGRGSGGKNVIFSNTSQATSECFKLLYYVSI